MTRCKRLRVFGFASLVALGLVIQFFFNPLGLGPEPSSVLGPSFFEKTVANMSDIDLLIDGKEAFDAVFEALDSAKESIYIQTYIWKDDETGMEVVRKLKAAANRGVKVTVNKDLLGTVFELGDIVRGHPSPVFTRTGLRGYPNIEVNTRFFADNDHSKYFIVDQKTLIFGGMNIADEYHFRWHDYMVRIKGKDRLALFEDRVLRGKPWPAGYPAVVAVNDRHATEIRTGLREMIDHARKRIIVQHAYFSGDVIIDALLRAAQRGVKVDVILPRNPDTHGFANKVTINRLLSSKQRDHIRIFLYPRMSHAKVFLTDGEFIAVGSANLTPRSMVTSRELTLFAHVKPDAPLIRYLQEQMEADIAQGARAEEPSRLSVFDHIKAIVGKYVW